MDDFEDVELTPLVQAILEKRFNVIQSILQRSPELMQHKVDGMYPLSIAVKYGSPAKIVRTMCRCWPESVRARDNSFDFLALHHVSDKTAAKTVKFLVDEYPEALHCRNEQNRLPIHTSIKNGATVAAVRVMVERNPGSLLLTAGDGRLPIHLAVVRAIEAEPSSNLGLVTYLADRCPLCIRVKAKRNDKKGRFRAVNELPIQLAAETPGPNQLLVIVQLYNRYPESLNVGEWYNPGRLPIHMAAKAGGEQQLEVIDFLAGKNPESLLVATARGHLPVHVALQSRTSAGVIQRLSVEAIPQETRLGLLHFAIQSYHSLENDDLATNVSALVEALPASLRATDSAGMLPIHKAVWFADSSTLCPVLQRLVELDPESLLLPDADGDIPLQIALDGRPGKRTAEFLFKSCPQSALVAGADGNFPIHAALANYRVSEHIVELVKSIVKFCPEGSQRLGARGRTPMHLVPSFYFESCRGYRDSRSICLTLETAEALVQTWPGSLLTHDDDGNLPIHLAISSKRLSGDDAFTFVKFLIDRSPDSLRKAGDGGMLPLHVAVSKSDPGPYLVELLVDSWGGAIDERDSSGNLPLRLALANPTAPLRLIYLLMRAKPDLLRSRRS